MFISFGRFLLNSAHIVSIQKIGRQITISFGSKFLSETEFYETKELCDIKFQCLLNILNGVE